MVGAPKLGKYRLLSRLGTGGMAEVFLACSEGPAGFIKTVAIKRMRPELTTNEEFVGLFVEEARTASLLSHPNVCMIQELSADGGDYFMVMEYLEGVPLNKLIHAARAHGKPLDLRIVGGLIEQAAEGLHHAHEMIADDGHPYNIVHRDVSPPNLFVTVDGLVKVLDFGISKSRNSIVKTLTGQIRGKFSYMSPEQLRGKKLDRRSDLFSLGIVLFELLSGHRLFKRKSRFDIFTAITKEPIPPVTEFRRDVPEALAVAVARALEREPSDRYPSALALARDVRRALQPLGGPASAIQIAELVHATFGQDIEDKRQLLAQLLARPEPVKMVQHSPSMPTEPMYGSFFVDQTEPSLGSDTKLTTNAAAAAERTAVDLAPAPALDDVATDDLADPPAPDTRD